MKRKDRPGKAASAERERRGDSTARGRLQSGRAPADLALDGWRVFPCHSPVEDGCSCGKSNCQSVGKHPRTPKGVLDASADPEQGRKWWRKWPDANIGLATGNGLFVLDIDPRHDGDDGLQALEDEHGPLPATVEARTGGGGRHLYFRVDEPVRNSAGKLGPGLDVRGDGGYVLCPPSLHASGATYEWIAGPDDVEIARAPEWLLARLRAPTPAKRTEDIKGAIPHGERNVTLMSFAGSMRRAWMTEEEILAALEAVNESRCDPELEADAVKAIAKSVCRYEPGSGDSFRQRRTKDKDNKRLRSHSWPRPLGEAAYQGLPGKLVRWVEPESEADPAALLVQLLAAFGNAAGTSAFYQNEGNRHRANLYVAIVGDTAKSRKGTSWGRVRQLIDRADRNWAESCTAEGLSSAEGLLYRLRDPVSTSNGAGGEVVVDEGVTDKRLLVTEGEFAAVLKRMDRQGNALSPACRTLWDRRDAETLTRHNPMKATGAHFSIVAHITEDELRRELTATERANGFANRFLFICAKRARLLPFGGTLHPLALRKYGSDLRGALKAASAIGEVKLDPGARDLWAKTYERLSDGEAGLLGAITARAEPLVIRLALVYALMDSSPAIRGEHLQAALEVWRYSYESAAYIFGDQLGDRLGDDLLGALRSAGEEGLTRTDIRDHVGHRVPADRIDAALALLAKGRVAVRSHKTTGGKRAEIWSAT